MKETLYKGKQHAVGSFYSKCSLSWNYCFSAAKDNSQMQGFFPFSCHHNFPCLSNLPQVLFMALRSIQFGGSRWKVNKGSNYSCGEFNRAKVEWTVKPFQYVWLSLGSARLFGDPITKLRWERWGAHFYCRVDVEIWPYKWSLISKWGTRSRENRAGRVPP